ncbi:hypothetical protein ABXN37_09450 [Piscinibacter sakaiensis]|uniref:hypothetical protein n=1 Tax=Piscinibacter sakaiensis TaxID=1547922 RepID=UPI00372CBB41
MPDTGPAGHGAGAGDRDGSGAPGPALALALAAGAAPAFGQTPAVPPELQDSPALRVQHSGSAYHYLNGGGGQEERALMDARATDFPLKIVLAAGKGEYVVANQLSLLPAQGESLVVREVGPVLMVKAPPGRYALEAVYQGKTLRQSVSVGSGRQTVTLRFP